MVDEFQDTDQLQVDTIKRMAGEGFSRMCTVGDAQQSIYRFRGADVSVYRRHLRTCARAMRRASSSCPTTSAATAMLALCDRVFAQPQVFGAGFMSLAPGRAEAEVKRPLCRMGRALRCRLPACRTAGFPPTRQPRLRRGALRVRSRNTPRRDMRTATWWKAWRHEPCERLRRGAACRRAAVRGGGRFHFSTERRRWR